MKPADFLKQLDECGWLAAVPAAEQGRIRKALPDALKNGQPYLALAAEAYVPEFECPDDVREWVIPALVRASAGRFDPAGFVATVGQKRDTVRVSFETLGRRFETEADEREIDVAVRRLANEAVAQEGCVERFFTIPMSDAVGVVFVPPEVFRAALKLQVLPNQIMNPMTREPVTLGLERQLQVLP